jgi:dihydroorotase-like cyclic amidohydrolase
MVSGRLDSAILNGTVVSPFGSFLANVGIRGEKIVIVTTQSLTAKKRIDAEGKWILPGILDSHGHMLHCWKNGEGFGKETRRMALGGVTTYVDYAADSRGPLKAFPEWISHIETHSHVDMGIHPVMKGEESLSEIETLYERYGTSSIKFYFSAQEIELYPDVYAVNDGVLLRGFEIISRLGPEARAVVHGENWEIGWFLEKEFKAKGRTDGAVWTDAHPHICEEEGMLRACLYAERTRCPLYIAHIGIGTGPQILKEARRKGVDVVGETCPHYLVVDRDDRRIALAKHNPAVKLKEDQDLLWGALEDGSIGCVGSDHIATTGMEQAFAHKERDIWDAITGVPGSATILFTLLRGVRQKRITLERLVQLTSYHPARAFGL